MALHPMPDTREQWLANRAQFIGSSEIAALFGVQAGYAMSPFALWHVKRGLVEAPPVGGDRVTWGTRLEEVIAMAVAEEHGFAVSRGRFAIAEDCRAAASLDFELDADPSGEFVGRGVLECKNVDWLVHKSQWTNGEPPIHILLQLQHQLLCSGFEWGVVASLVGGNQLEVYRYAAKPELIAEMRRRIDAFWLSTEPPPVDGSESAGNVLRQLFPEPIDDAIDLSGNNEWSEAVQDFIDAQGAKKDAEKRYNEAKARVVLLLGDYRRGFGNGYSVSTAITPAKPDRPAEPGEIITGRAETRRYTAKQKDIAA